MGNDNVIEYFKQRVGESNEILTLSVREASEATTTFKLFVNNLRPGQELGNTQFNNPYYQYLNHNLSNPNIQDFENQLFQSFVQAFSSSISSFPNFVDLSIAQLAQEKHLLMGLDLLLTAEAIDGSTLDDQQKAQLHEKIIDELVNLHARDPKSSIAQDFFEFYDAQKHPKYLRAAGLFMDKSKLQEILKSGYTPHISELLGNSYSATQAIAKVDEEFKVKIAENIPLEILHTLPTSAQQLLAEQYFPGCHALPDNSQRLSQLLLECNFNPNDQRRHVYAKILYEQLIHKAPSQHEKKHVERLEQGIDWLLKQEHKQNTDVISEQSSKIFTDPAVMHKLSFETNLKLYTKAMEIQGQDKQAQPQHKEKWYETALNWISKALHIGKGHQLAMLEKSFNQVIEMGAEQTQQPRR